MSTAIANALAYNQDSTGIPIGSISEMRFGNGGTVVLSTGRVTYKNHVLHHSVVCIHKHI